MLVCCDNEGCVVDAKGLPFDLPALDDLRVTIAESGARFVLCTGRSVPYVEAMVQVLGLLDADAPCICEGGGVLYYPRLDRYRTLVAPVDAGPIRAVLPRASYREELGKLVAYSIYPEPGYTVEELYRRVCEADLAHVEITKSIAAVDVTPKGVDKAFGLIQLLAEVQLDPARVVAVGDSWNDLPILDLAGFAACPANAVPEVKAVADYVSPLAATRGVRDIIRRVTRERLGG